MNKLIHSITLPNYPTHYIQSNAVRAKYYKKGDKSASKYKGLGYKWREFTIVKKGIKTPQMFLVNKEGERVIKNIDECGKPNLIPIRGQDLFNIQSVGQNTSKIIAFIKQWFIAEWIKPKLVNIKYPLYIEFIYRSPKLIEGKLIQDIDNMRILYEKAIIDSIKIFEYKRESIKKKQVKVVNPKGFITEDSLDYINKISSEWLLSETRTLTINFYER